MDQSKKITKVKDVMKNQFIEMDGLMTVADAIKALIDNDANALIIEKRNEHDEYGIVLLSDIAKKVLAKDKNPERTNLYEIMTKPVIGISPDMDVRYCSRLFDQFGLSFAPVIESGKVIGMVGYHGLVLDGWVASMD